MKDVHNPTAKEIKRWAYQANKQEPIADWNIVISALHNTDLLLELASDPACPKRYYFLECLYRMVGNSVSRHQGADAARVEAYLAQAASSPDVIIANWVARSRAILHDLRKFDYAEWCNGGYAKRDTPHAS